MTQRRHRQTLRPKKSLGQHFLTDPNIARKIVAAIAPRADDLLLEIGPGEAALTDSLAQLAGKLVVVDVDGRVTERLAARYPGGSVDVMHGDFLTVDIGELGRRHGKLLRIAGNIPYNITSAILFHILDHRADVADATLMMQREVARRLVAAAGTKEYGILSVFCQLLSDVELLFDVGPNAFSPKPKVTSSVVRLAMLRKPRFPIADEEFFRRMVRSVFGKRRKTLRNSLRYFAEEEGFALPPSFHLRERPESLSVRELVELGNRLFEAHATVPAR